MPGYIVLGKFTEQGVSTIKDSPQRTKQIRAMAEKMGIQVVGVWMTMGEYDLVAVLDAPDDQTMAAFLLESAKLGGLTTQTMRAFSEEEVAQVMSRLT